MHPQRADPSAYGALYECPETRGLVKTLAGENIAVANAKGINLEEEAQFEFIQLTYTHAGHVRMSMYYDMMASRRLEIGHFNGSLMCLGIELRVPTPVNSAIYAALKPYANGAPDVPSG